MITQNTSRDNYEITCQEWQERFLKKTDPAEILKKLPEIKEEGDYLTLSHYSRKYGISRINGTIRAMDEDRPASLFTKLNIYTLIWYCKPHPVLSGQWIPFRELKNASPFGPAFQRTVLDVFSRTFEGHAPELESAFQKLHGTKLPHSDTGYQLAAFQCYPVQFLFWDGDDEFPAQSNILFDKNAVDFNHVESAVSIASEGVAELARAAGLTLANGAIS